MNISRYNPLNLFLGIIHVSSESVFRKLKYFLLFILIYATIIGVLNYKFNFMSENNELGQFHLLFSFCLSIIIGFRIKIAYSRWWEARGLWGTLVNNSRHLAMKFNNYIGFENDQDMKNYIAKFPLLLKYHLHRDINSCSQVIKNLEISHTNEHLPNLLIQNIVNQIGHYRLNSQISFEQFLALDSHIIALSDVVGGCEKILNTVPPPGFSIFTRFGLLFYMLIFPFGWVSSFQFFIIPILIVFIYILLGLEIIAEEMETPFGTEYNDLDLDNFAKNIETNINQIAKMPRS